MSMITKKQARDSIQMHLRADLGVEPKAATEMQFYRAVSMMTRELLSAKNRDFDASVASSGRKRVHYLCMEFLVGRSLKNSLFNLGILEPVRQALADMNVDLEELYELEPDAGLGNGGLGRLAACYMDGLATRDLPATGYCILYEYGIFRQHIVNGWQTETPDYWLPGGDVWLEPHPEQSVDVRFGGHIEEYWEQNYHHVIHRGGNTVRAIPYDMYIPGYKSKGVSTLRLWKAESFGMDMELFNKGDYVGAFGQEISAEAISKILYPNDNHIQGKQLRLQQQYFLVSASINDIVRSHIAVYGSMEQFAEKNAIHINDTHPALAIPELMRVLLDDCGYSWEKSWDIVTRTFAYTNHTILSEALERWNEDLFRNLMPRIYQIVVEINQRFCDELRDRWHLPDSDIAQMAILGPHEVRMANLCVVACHTVNGVSALHSGIIREQLFARFAKIMPYKFTNVTNGIAARRWLCQSNPGLTKLLCDTIGDGWKKDFSQLEKFEAYVEDDSVLKELARVKRENKERFARYVLRETGTVVNPDSIFDVHVKRLHEYKRQHMNALHILSLYQWIKKNPNAPFQPRTFIFGAKAAPGYYMAKQIIKFICTLRDVIAADPQVRGKLQIVYLEDYRVTLSELLMPAAEISEQISLAGKEASGTGNMKLMQGGAITLGTMDGANVEICQQVREENAIIFGLRAPEVSSLLAAGYDPQKYYNDDPVLREALDCLVNGLGGETFPDLYNNLRYQDPYLVLADFEFYAEAQRKAASLYQDSRHWQQMSLVNIANAGIFCADRAVEQYAKEIWGLR